MLLTVLCRKGKTKMRKVKVCLQWLLFALWCPVAVLILLMRLLVWIVAKAAYRLNQCAWKLHKKSSKLGNAVGTWFYSTEAFRPLREKHKKKADEAHKKALDEWLGNK